MYGSTSDAGYMQMLVLLTVAIVTETSINEFLPIHALNIYDF